MRGKRLLNLFLCILMVTALFIITKPYSVVSAESGRTWGTEGPIETNDSGDAWSPQVAIDPQGNAIAVWHQEDGPTSSIFANRYDATLGWGTATLIEYDNSGMAYGAKVGMDDEGNAVAVWYQNDGVQTNITANHYLNGIGWGTPEIVENNDVGNPLNLQIMVEKNGNSMIVWKQPSNLKDSIWSNRFELGVGWGSAELVEEDDGNNSYDPQIGLDESGNAIATWIRHNGTSRNVMANHYVLGTGWGTPVLLEPSFDLNTYEPMIAVGENKDAIVIWRQYDGARYDLWANHYYEGIGWSGPELVVDDPVGSTYGYSIEMDVVGNAMVVWRMWDGSYDSVHAKRYDTVSAWETTEPIELNDADSHDLVLSVNEDGIAMALWREYDGSKNNVWYNRYEPGHGWEAADLVEHDDTGSATVPDIAVSDCGNAVAVWYHNIMTVKNIWANYMDITPPSISINSPIDGTSTEIPVIFLIGVTEPNVQLVINGLEIVVESDGTFEYLLPLLEGDNIIKANATDPWGNWAVDTVVITYINPTTILREQLQVIWDELNETKDELNEVLEELESLQIEIDGTLDRLNTILTELNDTEDELSGTKDILNQTQNELGELNDDINQILNDLAEMQSLLNSSESDLQDAKDELENTQTELDKTKEDLETATTMMILLPIMVLVILIVIQLVLYSKIMKKLGGQGKTRSELPEESPPSEIEETAPESEEEEVEGVSGRED